MHLYSVHPSPFAPHFSQSLPPVGGCHGKHSNVTVFFRYSPTPVIISKATSAATIHPAIGIQAVDVIIAHATIPTAAPTITAVVNLSPSHPKAIPIIYPAPAPAAAAPKALVKPPITVPPPLPLPPAPAAAPSPAAGRVIV